MSNTEGKVWQSGENWDLRAQQDEANQAAWEVIFDWSNKGLLPSGFDKASAMMLDIHAAILAERERCAKIAERLDPVGYREFADGSQVASAIREPRS